MGATIVFPSLAYHKTLYNDVAIADGTTDVSIPISDQTYKHLRLMVRWRDKATGTFVVCKVVLNNDGNAANYGIGGYYFNSTNVFALNGHNFGTNGFWSMNRVSGASDPSGIFSNLDLTIYNYSAALTHLQASGIHNRWDETNNTTREITQLLCAYIGGSAITQINLQSNDANGFLTGSRYSVELFGKQ